MKPEQKTWGGKPYHSFDFEMRRRFGGKVWKLSLQSGCSCPNRDGTIGTGGCIFCSEGGSGEFAAPVCLSVREQIETAKARVAAKLPGPDSSSFAGYMAYFQSFTNTYGPVERLHRIFEEALSPTDILALSIGTRPDCLPDEMIDMLARLNRRKPVYVELGLQTIHERTAERINRGYSLPVFEDAVRRLKKAGLSVVVHLILGLPGESCADMEESVRYIAGFRMEGAAAVDGIKLQLLHILRGTVLGVRYLREQRDQTAFQAEKSVRQELTAQKSVLQGVAAERLALEEFTPGSYVDFLIDLIELLPPDMTVHRLTGDAPKRLLLAPLWSADKKRVLNLLTRRFSERGTWQGRRYLGK